jgi:hypothetical protein
MPEIRKMPQMNDHKSLIFRPFQVTTTGYSKTLSTPC